MDIRSNWLDRTIGFFSPKAEAMRTRQRAQAELLRENIRRFDAAAYGRRTSGWYAPPTSANKELEISLHTLRNRSRELVRNNPFARRAVQSIAVNAIGLGIRPSFQKRSGISDKQIAKLKEAFFDWADSTDCDYDNKQNYWGLQDLITRCLCESGEVLVRHRWVTDKNLKVPIQLQILEPDFIDVTKNSAVGFLDNEGGYNIQGVRFDKNGKRVGYWIYPVHPGEGGYIQPSILVPDSEISHVYDRERPGQVHGIPMLSTSAITLRDFDDYEQAQLIRQKIAACFAVFVQDNDVDITIGGTSGKKDRREKLEPGIIEYLPAGKQITMANPPTVQNYDEYATAILRKAAAGIGISYEMLTADLSNVNFSSGRMGWIEAHRLIQRIQMLILVPQMCTQSLRWFIEGCVVAGICNEKMLDVKCKWTPPRREMIDPVKESKALIDMIRAGMMSLSDVQRERGQDPETLMDEIIADFKKGRDNELYLSSDPFFDATRTNGGEGDPNIDETGDGDEQTGKQKKMLKGRWFRRS